MYLWQRIFLYSSTIFLQLARTVSQQCATRIGSLLGWGGRSRTRPTASGPPQPSGLLPLNTSHNFGLFYLPALGPVRRPSGMEQGRRFYCRFLRPLHSWLPGYERNRQGGWLTYNLVVTRPLFTWLSCRPWWLNTRLTSPISAATERVPRPAGSSSRPLSPPAGQTSRQEFS